MKCSLFFPWRKTVKQAAATKVPTLWMRHRPASSLQSQHITPRQIRESMGNVERQIQVCPIAPLQEQMQTVWFNLVHEYIKSKRKGGSHDAHSA